MSWNTVKTMLYYGAGVCALAYVITANWQPSAGQPGLAAALERPIHLPPLALVCGLTLVSLLLGFYRWAILARAQALPISFGEAIALGLLGNLYGLFLIGGVGGDVVRAALFARGRGRYTSAFSTVVMDRVLGLFSLLILVLIGGIGGTILGGSTLASETTLTWIVSLAGTVVAIAALVWLALGWLSAAAYESLARSCKRAPLVGTTLAEVGDAVRCYRAQPVAVSYAVGLAVVGSVCSVTAFWSAAMVFDGVDLGTIPSLGQQFLIVPVGWTVQMLFPSPGGLGGGEYSFGQLYLQCGSTAVAGILTCLAFRLVAVGWTIAGYFAFVAWPRRSATATELAPAIPGGQP